jgi:hypothetical protein
MLPPEPLLAPPRPPVAGLLPPCPPRDPLLPAPLAPPVLPLPPEPDSSPLVPAVALGSSPLSLSSLHAALFSARAAVATNPSL